MRLDLANRGDALGEMGDALPAVDLGTGRTARAIAVGRTHTCAILDTGKVKCWGTNNGQLGIGDAATRGDSSGEMGDALPVAELGTGRTAKAITAGDGRSCAILDNDSIKCWGTGFYGELGYGDMVYRGDNPGEMGDALPIVARGTGHTARAIVAGGSHTCAVREDRSLVCWGSSNLGALGRGSQGSWGAAPGQMGDALVPLDLGTGRSVVEVVSGNSHLCAKLDDDSLKCWGWAAWGQLGLGDTNSRGDRGSAPTDGTPTRRVSR